MCYLIPILIGLISALLGYLLGKLLGGGNNFKAELDAEIEKNRRLSADLNACNSKFSSTEKDYLSLKSSTSANADWEAKYNASVADNDAWKLKFAKLESDYNASVSTVNSLKTAAAAIPLAAVATDNSAELNALKSENSTLKARIAALEAGTISTYVFAGDDAKLAFGEVVKQDDLKIIEGIGPKIEELFHNAGIKTWKQLSELSQDQCRAILDSGGEHYQIHDPGTWPKQSEMAYKNQWTELKNWQDQLNAGK